MPDYSKAKIYCIKSSQTTDVYYGSTCSKLANRFSDHKCVSKKNSNTSSKQILQYNDAYIELVEEFPCNNKEELHIREGFYIRNNSCINKYIAGRTLKERTEANKENRKAYQKAYYEAKKQLIKN